MGLRLTAWLPQVATAKGGANGEADIVLAVGQQVAEQVSIHPVGGEPDADSPRYVEVKTRRPSQRRVQYRSGARREAEPAGTRTIAPNPEER